MTTFGRVPDHLLGAADLAWCEGRLGWRVTDQHGRPCNGGDAEPLTVGEWSAAIAEPRVCHAGWHLTDDPLQWAGCRVWLCEGRGECDAAGPDKRAWEQIRLLGEVDFYTCLDVRIRARIASAGHHRLDAEGADLRYADLRYANLRYASLWGADLRDANLRSANLRHADLRYANLEGANLEDADLRCANLRGANLEDANLEDADLRYADLEDANLEDPA